MPSRPKKKPSKKKLNHSKAQLIIHHSLPTIQNEIPERFSETNPDVKFCCEEELSGCETASVTCQDHSCHPNLVAEEEQERSKLSADHHQMADSSNGNGKLEETLEKVQDGEVVESVRDIAIDGYSVEHAKKEPAEAAVESPQVVESGVVEEKAEEVVPVVAVEKEACVVDDVVEPEVKEEKVEELYVPYVDETNGPPPVVEDDVSEEIEEKAKTDLVSNGVEESTLPSLISEEITNVASKGIEETEVSCSEEKQEEEVVPAAAADVVSKGIEEVKVPVVEEINTGESSGADYKATSESVEDETLKPSPEVPVSAPVESTDAAEGYGKREIPGTAEKPTIVSVTRAPLQPTSWRSCCGLFEVLRRSDR